MTYKKRNKNVQKTTKSNVSKNRSTRSVFKSNRTTLNTNIKQRQGIIGGNEVRIIGGTEVSPACGSNNNPNDDYGCKYPFMVHLEPRNSHELRCGASLIHPEWVLTAGHCVDQGYELPNQLKVRMGVHSQFGGIDEEWIEVINVDEVIWHPNYDGEPDGIVGTAQDYDIALLHLETPSTFTPIPLVTPIVENPNMCCNLMTGQQNGVCGDSDCIGPCYECPGQDGSGGFDYTPDVTIMGWGTTETENQSDVLMELETIYHPGECSIGDFLTIYDADVHMCIGDDGEGGCFGDSGGPAIMYNFQTNRDELVGITSFGSPNCNQSWWEVLHSVYTRVEYYLPWIYNTMDTWGGHPPPPPPSFGNTIQDICSHTVNQGGYPGGGCVTFNSLFQSQYGGSGWSDFVQNSEWCANPYFEDFGMWGGWYCAEDYHVWCSANPGSPPQNTYIECQPNVYIEDNQYNDGYTL